MKKNIKILILVILCVSSLLVLTGCDARKVGKCDFCGQTERLNRFVYENLGEVYYYCDTCFKLAKLFSPLGNMN